MLSKVSWFSGLFCLALLASSGLAQTFSDSFAGQPLITGTSALITGSNTNATVEPGEPLHARKIGGHSVWISWQAPASGIATFSTAGSTFDTLLDAFVLKPGNDPIFERLERVALNDDYALQKTSYLQFGANANQIYNIAVDGFSGAVGDISLQLNFLSSSNFQPTVVHLPGDQALRQGDPLILTMGLISTPSQLEVQWYLNGNRIPGAQDPTLVVNNLQETNTGIYSLSIELNDSSFFSAGIEIQVNSEAQFNVLAHDKLPDALQSGLVAGSGGSGSVPPPISAAAPVSAGTGGVVIGYNGTQIFSTTNATVDPTEPPICGQTGGASYWFAYVAPTNGVMSIDTLGSSFPTLLGVFTYTGVLTSYTNLIGVACDTNSGVNGLSSSVQFTTVGGANYYIVVDGINGARGTAHLNYSLSAGLPPQPPVVTAQPQMTPLVAANTPVVLGVVAAGTAPISYQWWHNSSRIRQQTNATYLIAQPSGQDAGNYFVVLTNIAGVTTSSVAKITVINAPTTSVNVASNWFISAYPGKRGYQYTADYSTSPASGIWSPLASVFPDYGGIIWLTNAMQANGVALFRVHTP